MALTEELIVNKIAQWERSIEGIKNSYSYSQNPDNLSVSQLPAVLHFIPQVNIKHKGSYNRWQNDFTLMSCVCVLPRQTKGGTLKFLENSAIQLMPKFRMKFQTDTVVNDILGLANGTVRGFLTQIQYGAGIPMLTINSVEYIGIVCSYEFTEII